MFPSKASNTSPRVDAHKLWRDLQEMGSIGATPTGGVCRLALTQEDKLARDLFVDLCNQAGYCTRVDAMGNIYARRPGIDNTLPPVVTGSHLDSQPVAGKYDGPYGVLAGLEVLRTLDRHGIETHRPLDVVVWTNEEGARFRPTSLSSSVVAGVTPLQTALDTVDDNGIRFGDALETIGYAGSIDPIKPAMHCYVEAHIEQGPILERENAEIGIVGGVVGIEAYEVELIGQAAHTGTTPINSRRDALLGAAQIIAGVRQLALRHEPTGRASVAFARISPNVRSVIAENVLLTADCRSNDETQLDAMRAEMLDLFSRVAKDEQLDLQVRQYWSVPPTHFSSLCIEAVRRATKDLGYSSQDLYSGAAHDAMHIARIAPSAMIFIPCMGGISHNEAESITVEQAQAGANVLLHTLLALSV